MRNPHLFAGHASFLVELVDKRLFARRGEPSGYEAVSRTLLDQLQQACTAVKVPLLVLQIPGREETRFAAGPRRRRRPLPAPMPWTVDALPVLVASQRAPYLPDDHLNRAGHQLVADLLERAIMAKVAKQAAVPPR